VARLIGANRLKMPASRGGDASRSATRDERGAPVSAGAHTSVGHVQTDQSPGWRGGLLDRGTTMQRLRHLTRLGLVAIGLASVAGCSSTGGLGNVLGGVLGQPSQTQVSGTIIGANARNGQLTLQENNGQSITVAVDNNTQVTSGNQTYGLGALQRGDQVVARLQSANNGNYYADLIQVTQSVQGSNSRGVYNGRSVNVQRFQGTVRQVDYQNQVFTMDVGNYNTVTVSMPYQLSRNDLGVFQNLRSGNYVQIAGVLTANNRVEFRQFY
jgi:hypothetical protein